MQSEMGEAHSVRRHHAFRAGHERDLLAHWQLRQADRCKAQSRKMRRQLVLIVEAPVLGGHPCAMILEPVLPSGRHM